MRFLQSIKDFVHRRRILTTKAQILNVWELKTKNIGDLNAAPCLYFKLLNKNALNVSVMSFSKEIKLKNKIIIIGGGSLFLSYFEKSINNLLKLAKDNILIIWGVGYDNYLWEKTLLNFSFDNVYKIGLRDYPAKYDYVPCASCLSELFDIYKSNTNKGKYCLYLYEDYSAEIKDDLSELPCLTNKGTVSFSQVLDFLGSYEIILTNSYHGMYWGTLLGKKIIVLPWIDKKGNVGFTYKFKMFKYTPCFCKNWKEYKNFESKLKSYPQALSECRDLNNKFYQQIKDLF